MSYLLADRSVIFFILISFEDRIRGTFRSSFNLWLYKVNLCDFLNLLTCM